MSIERAEQLKREFTDRWVLVRDGVPELRRFQGLTGRVKTVNMNCRVLVQFDGPVDISWYDIDPTYLKVVDAPLPKKVVVEEKKEKAVAPAGEKPAAKPAGKSPLELAREQAGAASGKTSAPPTGEKKLSPLEQARLQGAGNQPAAPKTAAPTPSGDKKLSPLEQARLQGAAGNQPAASAPAPVETPAPAPQPTPAAPADGKTLSPLELARQQGAAKRD